MPQPNTYPKDRLAREHVGALDRVVWNDPASGAVIAKLRDGVAISGRADAEGLAEGQQYRFLGRWTEHPKYGPQFRFETYTAVTPAGRNGVVRYLTQLCDGIGEKRAAALYDAYGSETVVTLRTNPVRVAADGVLPEDVAKSSAEQLAAAVELEGTRIDLFELFAGRGFPADGLIRESIAQWGAKAPARIRRNPFALMVAEFPGCGFKRCDKLYQDLGLPVDRLKRQMLAGWYDIRTNTMGDTWFPVEQAVRAVRQATQAGARPERAVRLGLRAKWFKGRRDAAGKAWIAERDKALNEQKIADAVGRLVRQGEVCWPAATVDRRAIIGPLGKERNGPKVSDHQREKLRLATELPIGILAGTPGTGKTYTAAALLHAIIDQYGANTIAVVAPTGKAAVRITQAMKSAGLNLRATTIHRLLGLGKASAAKGERPNFDCFNPLPFDFVFVDETSMCDTDILGYLLDACADTAHVLLVGDPYQLPPVGHGAPLRDLIAAGVPCGELTEIRRNAGMIVRACAQIKDGRPFETAAKFNKDAGDNLVLMDCQDEVASLAALDRLLQRCGESGQFHPVWQTQVIVGVNDKGEVCRKKLNERLQQTLNPDGRALPTHPFKVGDKIICLKNGFMKPVDAFDADEDDPTQYGPARDRSGTPVTDVYIANGEIGRVLAIGPVVTIARFSEAEYAVRIPMGKSKDQQEAKDEKETEKGRGCNFDLGYAITVHKSQGSEAPLVICMADDAAARIASREFWYTAISRASQLCVIIGKRATVEKQARRVALKRRKTFLTELVKEILAPAETTA
jgi:exodeoxyribonuclease V alpha subunit